jgi:predicted phage-related endonuclease
MHDLTASDLGAAVGVDPYRSPLRVYAEKAGEIRADGESNIMRRGRWLETAALEALREELPGWRIERANVYLRDPEVRLGATPDALAEDPEHPERLINVQVKVVARPTYERDWADDRTPLAYQLQTLAEGFLLDADRSLLVALVIDTYSADVVVREIARHAGAEQRIREIAAEFWENIATGRRPAPDYGKDGETLAAMFPPRPDVAPLDLGTDNRMLTLLDERRDLKTELKACEEDLAKIDAEIVDKLKGATSATAGEWRISRKIEERRAYTVAASSRAVLRVRQIEEKEKAA